MKFRTTPLAGAWVIEPEPFADSRGHFARTFCRREFEEHGIDGDFVQANSSWNVAAGTLRGVHFQLPPHEEGKLVRCTRGAIYDAIVDLRPDSDTLAQSYGIELSADNGLQLFVPRGFGHAFLTLEDHCEVTYLMSEFYAPGSGAGYRYDDPAFAIEWPRTVEVIADKDLELPRFDKEQHARRVADGRAR